MIKYNTFKDTVFTLNVREIDPLKGFIDFKTSSWENKTKPNQDWSYHHEITNKKL
jgi:hypothetical protein